MVVDSCGCAAGGGESAFRRVQSPTGYFCKGTKVTKNPPRGHPLATPKLRESPMVLARSISGTCSPPLRISCPAAASAVAAGNHCVCCGVPCGEKPPLCNGPGRPLLSFAQFTLREVARRSRDGGIDNPPVSFADSPLYTRGPLPHHGSWPAIVRTTQRLAGRIQRGAAPLFVSF